MPQQRISMRTPRSVPVFAGNPIAQADCLGGMLLERISAAAQELPPHTIHKPHVVLRLSDDLELGWHEGGRELILEFERQARNPDCDVLYGDSLKTTILARLRHDYGTAEPAPFRGGLSPAKVALLTDYIESHLQATLRLGTLAGLAGLSVTHFSACFTRTMKIPPHAFVTQRRVERAKRVLSASALPLLEVAIGCGFGSQSHFTQAFRRATGYTPAAWRRAQRNRP